MLYFSTDGPTIGSSFQNLQNNWLKVNKSIFDPLNFNIFQPKVRKLLAPLKDEVVRFLHLCRKSKLRGDYMECVELGLILLGEKIEGFSFKAPQGLSKARWMCKVIYAMKELLLYKELKLDKVYVKKLTVFCTFCIFFYIKPWLRAAFPAEAAQTDLEFFQNMIIVKEMDLNCAQKVSDKILRHTWYLSGELVGLAVFSGSLSFSEKRLIITKMKEIDADWSVRSIKSEITNFSGKKLCDFVDTTTRPALEGLGIDLSFIELDPIEWDSNPNYIYGKEIVDNLGVINDSAERKVRLMSDFNVFATKTEAVKQQILKNTEFTRQQHPNYNKSTLTKHLFK